MPRRDDLSANAQASLRGRPKRNRELTSYLQDKIETAETKTEELTETELEQAVGGADAFYGRGVYKTTDGGRT